MSKKILIVDDEPKIVEICRDYLKAAFFDTISANDGPSALAAVAPCTVMIYFGSPSSGSIFRRRFRICESMALS